MQDHVFPLAGLTRYVICLQLDRLQSERRCPLSIFLFSFAAEFCSYSWCAIDCSHRSWLFEVVAWGNVNFGLPKARMEYGLISGL